MSLHPRRHSPRQALQPCAETIDTVLDASQSPWVPRVLTTNLSPTSPKLTATPTWHIDPGLVGGFVGDDGSRCMRANSADRRKYYDTCSPGLDIWIFVTAVLRHHWHKSETKYYRQKTEVWSSELADSYLGRLACGVLVREPPTAEVVHLATPIISWDDTNAD